MANYQSINPFTQEEYRSYDLHDQDFVEAALAKAEALKPSQNSFEERARKGAVLAIAEEIRIRKEELATAMSREMGKVRREAISEIEKCAWLCEYYAENSSRFLSAEKLDLGEDEALRVYEPLGTLLGIMPWNFPFWQVFRFAIPALLAGNKVLLKHAPNCPHSAELIEEILCHHFPAGAYCNLRLNNDQAAELLADSRIKGLSLTGSTQAGSAVAALAAKQLKPQLLELGGSNAFILFEDADIDKAVQLASKARLLNAGQSCIAAKRFLVPEPMLAEFEHKLRLVFQDYRIGDPLDPNTDIGPLARPDLAEKLEGQVKRSMEQGASLVYGAEREGNFIRPGILRLDHHENCAFQEELFGPIAVLMPYRDVEEAISLSNDNPFGLGVSLIGSDVDYLISLAPRFEEGAVFINELVKSDPRLPFGGVKNSGYGRELGPEGIKAFTNLKTIYIKRKLE